ncbi:MAG: hypothetical protein LC624_07095 [Halobacteriales archaeon]|nr:hypothetical protein [Halobacteriales archaeon]
MEPLRATLPHAGGTLHLVGTVPGLKSEGSRIGALFEELRPSAVALGVGPEDLAGLQAFVGGATFEPMGNDADDVYEHYLRQYGEVELPPPDFVAIVQLAGKAGLPIVALDLPEVAYVTRFTEEVSGWALLRYNRRIQQLARHPPPCDDAVSFHLWWDEQLRRLAGFAAVERAREQAMAARLRAEAWPAGDVLVVLEAARLEGVVRGSAGPLAETAGPVPAAMPIGEGLRPERATLSARLHKRLK